MAQPQRMIGALRVVAAQAPDGTSQVATTLPNGARFFLPPAEAMTYAFSLLICARDLFPSKDALNAAVPTAYDRVDEILTRSPSDVQ